MPVPHRKLKFALQSSFTPAGAFAGGTPALPVKSLSQTSELAPTFKSGPGGVKIRPFPTVPQLSD
jgi:hypothetical protein